MGYRQFFKGRRSYTQEPMVTIGSSGNLYLNVFVMRNYFTGIQHVIILFDEGKKSFAIKPSNEQKEGVYTLGFSSKESKSTGYVAARSFVNLPFITKHKGKKLKGIWNEKEKLLEIKL